MSKTAKKKLGLTCTSTDCENGLHCFKQTKKTVAGHIVGGRCRDCGADLVDWPRITRRELSDVEYTFRSLKYEMIRHHFWHQELDIRAMNYALRKGIDGLIVAAEKRIRITLRPGNPFDGRQTGKSGNPVLYAQHACAVCCRKCVEYWHGIERNRELSADEVNYLTKLIMLYIKDRLPNLPSEGQYVPPIRRSQAIEEF
ncbi:MAG: DUF4186 family protein [Acidobacteria bacterium]|nr:DUF4186 family protein [Acidobacteriota bacterium]